MIYHFNAPTERSDVGEHTEKLRRHDASMHAVCCKQHTVQKKKNPPNTTTWRGWEGFAFSSEKAGRGLRADFGLGFNRIATHFGGGTI